MTKAKDMIKAKDPIKVKSGRNLILPLQDLHKDYLKDESRISGKAETISFPENETQVQDIVKILLKQKTPITVQGSRTGITGGAVPMGGHILNLSKMIKVTGLERDSDGQFSIRVQPGIFLAAVLMVRLLIKKSLRLWRRLRRQTDFSGRLTLRKDQHPLAALPQTTAGVSAHFIMGLPVFISKVCVWLIPVEKLFQFQEASIFFPKGSVLYLEAG
jgi:hypothetical protein